MAESQRTEEKADESQVSQATGTDSVPAQETDWKAQARRWEERAKTNKKRADQLEGQLKKLETTSGDLEKALARISALEEHNQELEHSKLIGEVAAEKKIDPGLLTGYFAEMEGFEPSSRVSATTPLAGERFRPLSHISKS